MKDKGVIVWIHDDNVALELTYGIGARIKMAIGVILGYDLILEGKTSIMNMKK